MNISHWLHLSVVIDNLEITGAGSIFGPLEANPPLKIDSNTVLPAPIPTKRFKMIGGQGSQVIQTLGSVEDS
jgi:hypothetical protein